MKKFEDMIEDYLEDRLSKEDRMAFVEELTINRDLQNELKKHQIAYSIIEMGIENSLRKKLNELGDDPQPVPKSSKTKTALIGIILMLILLTIYFLIR